MTQSPVQFLTEHEETVLGAYRSTGGPKKAWELLRTELPEIGTVMKYNTFRQYVTPFSIIMRQTAQRSDSLRNESEKAAQEHEKVAQQLHTLRNESEKAAQEHEKVAQQLHTLRNESEKAAQEHEKVAQQLHTLRNESEKNAQEHERVTQQLHTLRNESEKAAQEYERVTQQLHKAGKTCSELEVALSLAERKTAELIQENAGLMQENAGLINRAEELGNELHRVTQEREAEKAARVTQQLHKDDESGTAAQKSQKKPVTIDGWSLQRAKDGYCRLHRKIRGRVHSIYLGKTPDPDEARRKIAAKEKALGIA